MSLRKYLGLAAAAALMVFSAGQAQAAHGVFDFTSTVLQPVGGVAPIGPGTSNLVFTGASGTAIDGTLPGGADIIFGNVDFNPGNPTGVFAYNVPFQYLVTLTSHGDSESFNVSGAVTGFARGGTPRAINSNIVNFAVNPVSQIIGGATFIVTPAQSTGPGSAGNIGVLQLNVTAVPVPEPSSMALVGIGVVGLIGLGLRRRMRKALDAAAA